MSKHAATVQSLLPEFDALPANEITKRSGLRHEQVYEALVWLEARGMARVACDYEHAAGRPTTGWRAGFGLTSLEAA